MLNWVTPAIVENQPPILPLHSSLRLQAAHNDLVFPFTLLPYHHLSHLDDLAQGTALLWLVSSVHIAPPSISFDCVRPALHSFDKEACVPLDPSHSLLLQFSPENRRAEYISMVEGLYTLYSFGVVGSELPWQPAVCTSSHYPSTH